MNKANFDNSTYSPPLRSTVSLTLSLHSLLFYAIMDYTPSVLRAEMGHHATQGRDRPAAMSRI